MYKLFDLGEKGKLIISFIIFLLISILLLFAVNIYSMNKISSNYMKQNMALVGTVAKNDPVMLDKIIPIITRGEMNNYSDGEKILAKYSYKSDNITSNPVIYGQVYGNYMRFLSVVIVLFLSLMIYIFLKFNKVYKALDELNKKAEFIVEGNFVEADSNIFGEGILNSLSIQFSLMQNRIKSSIDALKDEKINLKNIINDISHQLKTPIAAMTMYTDILKDSEDMDKTEVEYFLNLTREQIGRMDWLVKTLLKYARLESNVVEYKKMKQSLNETIEDAINQFELLAKEKNIKLKFVDSPKNVMFIHDRKWIQEALMNIIKNGIEHTKSGGFIKVMIEESEVFVRVKIQDNGEGISAEEIPKIFKRFHKGSNSVNPKSIGIGLSLSKSIIKGHKGDIKVQSELNNGSEFIITFIK